MVTADVGGTSFDTCLILDGRPQIQFEGKIVGLPVQSPWVDVRSIGAGGGSIAWVDKGGLLRVGPQSSGSNPGPACYGLGGTDSTVTDANLSLNRINPNYFLGGSMNLNIKKSQEALKILSSKLDSNIDLPILYYMTFPICIP